MAKIYLIRHAESVANTQGRYQGQTYDTHLSVLGKKQVLALQKRLVKIKFDAIFSSPLLRTIETAEVLGNPTLIKEILETNHGQWEGKTKDKIVKTWPDMYAMWLNKPSKVIFPEGEKFAQTAARAINWITKLQNKKGTFAVITHSNIIFTILCHHLGKNLDEMWQFDVQPTCVSLLETNSGKLEVKYYNDSSHLNGLASNLAIQAI
mgnify:CR=1 FL=1